MSHLCCRWPGGRSSNCTTRAHFRWILGRSTLSRSTWASSWTMGEAFILELIYHWTIGSVCRSLFGYLQFHISPHCVKTNMRTFSVTPRRKRTPSPEDAHFCWNFGIFRIWRFFLDFPLIVTSIFFILCSICLQRGYHLLTRISSFNVCSLVSEFSMFQEDLGDDPEFLKKVVKILSEMDVKSATQKSIVSCFLQ